MFNLSAKFDKETSNGLVSIVFTRSTHGQTDGTTEPQQRYYIPTATRCAGNALVCIRFTAYFHICPWWPWPLTSKINRVHPLTMVNMSAKFDKEIHNGLVSIMFTSLFPYMPIVTLTFDLWPPKSIGFILSSWLMSAKFDQEAQNALAAIVFTSLFPYMSTVTLTFDLWPPK